MQRALPGDNQHQMYRAWRSGVSDGIGVGTFFVGGISIAKGAYSLVQRGMSTIQKLGRSSMPMINMATNQGFQLNRFHQAARNLSETGQNNIRILRGWAKSKGTYTDPSTGEQGAKIAEVVQLERRISEWLGNGTKFIRNEAGDPIFLSKDGLRRVRFDFNRPSPHNNLHAHIQTKLGLTGKTLVDRFIQ
jgi:hypothetical protein